MIPRARIVLFMLALLVLQRGDAGADICTTQDYTVVEHLHPGGDPEPVAIDRRQRNTRTESANISGYMYVWTPPLPINFRFLGQDYSQGHMIAISQFGYIGFNPAGYGSPTGTQYSYYQFSDCAAMA